MIKQESPPEKEDLPPEGLPEKEIVVYIPTELITLTRPVLQFGVLDSFARHGVYFTNLEDGEPIDGLLYQPSIGISLTPPEKNSVTGFGFSHLQQRSSRKLAPNTFEVDGVLYFEYKGRECITGQLSEDTYLFFVKIWNDIDMKVWLEIIEKAVADNTEIKDGAPYPHAYFFVSSAFVPRNATEPSRLVLPKHLFSRPGEAAVSREETYPPEENINGFHPKTPIF
jgi:hypothetical protein